MMKFYGLIILFFLFGWRANAQNMLSNGNFEQYTTCPSLPSQLGNCIGWQTVHTGTTDFFNKCAIASSNVSVPANLLGYQVPASGNGYIGLFSNAVYKEYAKRSITSLTVGQLYEVSMSVSLANGSNAATSDLGAWFYTGATTFPSTGYLGVTPQISYSNYGPVFDTVNWVRLKGAFVADHTYDSLVIGGFGSPTTTIQVPLSPATTPTTTYYYIDSVVVEPANISLSLTDSTFCIGDTLKVPFLVSALAFTIGNKFYLQLSNASGSFSSPVTLDSIAGNGSATFHTVIPSVTLTGMGYRVRIISTSIADTSDESRVITIGGVVPAKPSASVNNPICELDSIALKASSTTAGVSYSWTGPSSFSSTNQNPVRKPAFAYHSGNYIVTAYLNGCTSKDTVSVSIIPTSGHLIGSSNSLVTSPICEYDTLKLYGTVTVSGITDIKWVAGTGIVSYSKDTMFVPHYATQGIYTLIGRDGLCFARSTINIRIKPMPPNVKITANTVVCEGDSLYLNAPRAIGGNLMFSWKGPAGFVSTQQNLSFDPVGLAQNGHYVVTETLEGCTAKDSTDVEVRPTAGLIDNWSNSPVCEGDTLKLYGRANAPNNAGFLWLAPGGGQFSSQDTIVVHASHQLSGKYILFGNFNNCAASDTADVIIKAKPDTFSAVTNAPVCDGDTLKLWASASTGISTFGWNGPNGFGSASKDTLIAPARRFTSGLYILTGYYDNCSVSDTVTVLVKPLPDSLYAFSNAPLCEGGDLKLSAHTLSPGSRFIWYGPGFTSTLEQPVITNVQNSSTGNYTVVADLDGCRDSTSISVAVTPRPQKPEVASNSPVIIGGVLKLTANDTISGVDYVWQGPAGFNSLTLNPVINEVDQTNAGTYILTATENGCSSSDSADVIINSDTSYFNVYPNASNGNFKIRGIVKRDQQIEIRITADNGQLVYKTVLLTHNKLLDADILLRDAVASGIYTLRLLVDNNMYDIKLVVVRQ